MEPHHPAGSTRTIRPFHLFICPHSYTAQKSTFYPQRHTKCRGVSHLAPQHFQVYAVGLGGPVNMPYQDGRRDLYQSPKPSRLLTKARLSHFCCQTPPSNRYQRIHLSTWSKAIHTRTPYYSSCCFLILAVQAGAFFDAPSRWRRSLFLSSSHQSPSVCHGSLSVFVSI